MDKITKKKSILPKYTIGLIISNISAAYLGISNKVAEFKAEKDENLHSSKFQQILATILGELMYSAATILPCYVCERYELIVIPLVFNLLSICIIVSYVITTVYISSKKIN